MSSSLDIQQIIDRDEHLISGKKVLYVKLKPDIYSEKLLIVMSAHNHGQKYMALRSFLENQACDILFLTDPKNSWYLDDNNGETFQEVIYRFSKSYDEGNVFLYGSSMSGYGAILHALRLNLNAIASNPQINLHVTKDYAWPELVEHITDLKGNHTNIDEAASSIWQESGIYVIHGHEDIDTANAQLLLNATPSSKKLIIQTVDIDAHSLYFGKNTNYVYDVMDMLSIFRLKLDLSATIENLTDDSMKAKKSLRLERKRSNVVDPIRSLATPKNGALWQDRYKYESAGSQSHFGNIGFYHHDCFSGGICFFDGKHWRLTSIPYQISDNLIACNDFTTDGEKDASENNSYINAYWWVRNESLSAITVSGLNETCEIDLSKVNSKNIYLHSTVPGTFDTDTILGQTLTFTADILTTNGEVSISLGGVGDSGYHHKNSEKSSTGNWERLVVCEQFTSVQSNHKDRIFVRINLATDGKTKVVKIKNACLTLGYFPMGFSA